MESVSAAGAGSDGSMGPGGDLADLRWLGELARRLIADPGLADDACQEAWISASRGGTVATDRRDLARALRRFLWRARRGERRRRRREASASRAEALPSTAELIEAGEQRQRVWEHLKRLDEPYRSTLLLRFQEDLSTAAIGERLNLRDDTVRRRVRDGLDRLRRSLERDRAGGGLSAVALALPTPIRLERLASAASAGASAFPLGLGALLMSKLVVALAAAGIAALLWVSVREDPAPSDRSLPRVPPAARTLAGEASEAPRTSSVDGPAPQRIAAPAAAAAADDPATAAEAPALIGRVVDSAGAPREGVEVRLSARRRTAASTTAADGTFRVAIPSVDAPRIRMQLVGPPFVARRTLELGLPESRPDRPLPDRHPGAVTDLGDLPLPAAGRVCGRVVEPSGRPVEGARVAVGGSNWFFTGPDGTFNLEHATLGLAVCSVEARDWLRLRHELTIDAARRYDLGELVLTRAPRVRGRVVDPTGEPVPTATVDTAYGDVQWRFPVEPDGSFDVSLPSAGEGRLRAMAPGYERPADPIRVRPGTEHVELRLEPLAGEPVALRFVDATSGAPLDFVAFELDRNGMSHRGPVPAPRIAYSVLSEGPTDDGWVRLTAEAGTDIVDVVAYGYASAAVTVSDAAARDGQVIALGRPPGIHGRVVDGGRPVDGAEVTLSFSAVGAVVADREGVDPVEALDPGPVANLLSNLGIFTLTPTRVVDPSIDGAAPGARLKELARAEPNRRRATTGPDGRFRFADLPPSGLRVVARSADGDLAVSSKLEANTPGADLNLGDLELEPTGRIEGRLSLARGGELAGHVFRIAETGPYRATTDATGRFVLDGLPAGGHLLDLAHDTSLIVDDWSTEYFVRVPAGGARAAVIELDASAAATVRLRLQHNGVWLDRGSVNLRSDDGWFDGDTLGDAGVAEIVAPAGVPLTPHLFTGGGELPIGAPTAFAPGDNELSLAFESGALAVELPKNVELPGYAEVRLHWTDGEGGPAGPPLGGQLDGPSGRVAEFAVVPRDASGLELELLGGPDSSQTAPLSRWAFGAKVEVASEVAVALP